MEIILYFMLGMSVMDLQVIGKTNFLTFFRDWMNLNVIFSHGLFSMKLY